MSEGSGHLGPDKIHGENEIERKIPRDGRPGIGREYIQESGEM
jgi:hypothetical protein